MDNKSSRTLSEAKKTPVYSPEGEAGSEEEYELMPHKEISELRDELRRVKSMPPEAGKRGEMSYQELIKRMDRLIEIFTEAEHQLKIEEGAVSFKEKMAPLVTKMDKVLEQNSEIAEGVVALADILNEIKDKIEVGVVYKPERESSPEGMRPMPAQQMPPMGMPPMAEMSGEFPPMGPPPMPGMMPPPPMPRAPAPGPYPAPPRRR